MSVGNALGAGRAARRSAVSVADDVRAGRCSAESVVVEGLDVIDRLNPWLNALVEVRGEEALLAARELDVALGRGEPVGPLAGVPVVIKDSVWERGRDATAGSRSLLGHRPAVDAVVVERLVDAGAIVIGRSNLPEFCYRGDCSNDLYGTTVNPWAIDRTPGGSSGGSAAAVAAGMAPIAIGSDGGGSIRIPAAFTGVVGHKQTYGLVPRTPGWPGWYDLNHVGPLAGSVHDVARTLSVIAGRHPADPSTSSAPLRWPGDALPGLEHLRGLRIAVSEDLGYIPVDDTVRSAFRHAVETLRRVGLDLTEACPPTESPLGIWNTLTFADNVASEGELLRTGRVGADTATLIRAGEAVTGPDYARARNARALFTGQWQSFMQDYDLVLTPTMECVAFPASDRKPRSIGGRVVDGDDDDWCHFCYPFNLTGQPALSVPMPVGPHDLPVGLQIVGRTFEDRTVLGLGALWEELHPPRLPVVDEPTDPASDDIVERFSDALVADEDTAVIPGRRRVSAGQVLSARDGTLIRVRRAFHPDGDGTVVEFETVRA